MNKPRRFIASCDCIGTCSIMMITEWEQYGNENYESVWEFYEHVPSHKNIKDRIRVAWAVLRKKEPYMAGAVLGHKEVTEMRDFLSETIAGKDGKI